MCSAQALRVDSVLAPNPRPKLVDTRSRQIRWTRTGGTGRAAQVPCVRRKMELSYQTGRPTVAELLRMPPSMELLVETGPLQLHLPLSAFL